MSGYMQKTLLKFQHPSLKNPEYAPFKVDLKQYGAKIKFPKVTNGTPELSEAAIKPLKKKI